MMLVDIIVVADDPPIYAQRTQSLTPRTQSNANGIISINRSLSLIVQMFLKEM